MFKNKSIAFFTALLPLTCFYTVDAFALDKGWKNKVLTCEYGNGSKRVEFFLVRHDDYEEREKIGKGWGVWQKPSEKMKKRFKEKNAWVGGEKNSKNKSYEKSLTRFNNKCDEGIESLGTKNTLGEFKILEFVTGDTLFKLKYSDGFTYWKVTKWQNRRNIFKPKLKWETKCMNPGLTMGIDFLICAELALESSMKKSSEGVNNPNEKEKEKRSEKGVTGSYYEKCRERHGENHKYCKKKFDNETFAEIADFLKNPFTSIGNVDWD